jgi:hypothetical protein
MPAPTYRDATNADTTPHALSRSDSNTDAKAHLHTLSHSDADILPHADSQRNCARTDRTSDGR